tara:strand:- start:686 stop:904 length:219 start_codon:yes stop_codon:yes gene_type:complete
MTNNNNAGFWYRSRDQASADDIAAIDAMNRARAEDYAALDAYAAEKAERVARDEAELAAKAARSRMPSYDAR